MEKEENAKLFGLLGRNISYSFSRGYFTEKFKKLELNQHRYINFDVASIDELPKVLQNHKNELIGFNVTIPYKKEIIPFLDEVDAEAKEIGAVNTVAVTKNGILKGYNTDYHGFKNSLQPLLNKEHKRALILGTGGASKAVAFALEQLNIDYNYVSRVAREKNHFTYRDLSKNIVSTHLVIINCTPLGTHPNIEQCPDIPYEFITKDHLLYDLIYNPSKTQFLTKGEVKGAIIKNGLEMLELQAEKAWEIWQKS